jgi:esterase
MADDSCFLQSLVEYHDGWGFRFSNDYMIRSEQLMEGDGWDDWLASDCPALLLQGNQSWTLETAHAREMAARRPNTRLVEFPDSGHTIHDDNPAEYSAAVGEFLDSLGRHE